MLNKQNSSIPFQPADQAGQFDRTPRSLSSHRFIEHEQFRIARQSHSNLQLAFFSVGQVPGRRICLTAQIDALGLAPQIFEGVIVARLFVEQVNDDRSIVEHDPAAFFVAGNAHPLIAQVVFQRMVDLFAHRVQLAAAGAGGDGAQNPFQTIERQDIGISLKVKPQINEGDAMRLDIEQEVSSIADSVAGASDIITNKRSIKTNVMVDDGQVVVLGGLIEEVINESVQKVPLLGDLPVLGVLFRNKSITDQKSELLIFLTPKIITPSFGLVDS